MRNLNERKILLPERWIRYLNDRGLQDCDVRITLVAGGDFICWLESCMFLVMSREINIYSDILKIEKVEVKKG